MIKRAIKPMSISRTVTTQEIAPGSRSLNLHIGRLVLDGFAAADGQRIGAAVRQELARLIAVRGIAQQSLGESGKLRRAAPIRLAAGIRPQFVGKQIARSVFGGLCRRNTGGGVRI